MFQPETYGGGEAKRFRDFDLKQVSLKSKFGGVIGSS